MGLLIHQKRSVAVILWSPWELQWMSPQCYWCINTTCYEPSNCDSGYINCAAVNLLIVDKYNILVYEPWRKQWAKNVIIRSDLCEVQFAAFCCLVIGFSLHWLYSVVNLLWRICGYIFASMICNVFDMHVHHLCMFLLHGSSIDVTVVINNSSIWQ